jgi:hypothetical protein
MALDPLEKERLRKRMALKMGSFLESGKSVSCVSGHYYDEPHLCELCGAVHADEILVVKNRAGRKMSIATPCLREMVRFQVTDVDDLPRWLEKLKELRVEAERRKLEREEQRQEERKRLEKRLIVRKRVPTSTVG